MLKVQAGIRKGTYTDEELVDKAISAGVFSTSGVSRHTEDEFIAKAVALGKLH